MSHPEMPPIGISFPWWSRSSRRDGEGCGSRVVLYHVLIMDLLNVKGDFRGFGSLDPEIEVIPSISSLPKLSVGYHVCVKPRNVGNVLKMEKLLAGWCINVDLELAVAFYIGTAISSKDKINLIRLLEGGLIKAIEVVADMKGGAAV